MEFNRDTYCSMAHVQSLADEHYNQFETHTLNLIYGHGTLVITAKDGEEFIECWCTDLLHDDSVIYDMIEKVFADAIEHDDTLSLQDD